MSRSLSIPVSHPLRISWGHSALRWAAISCPIYFNSLRFGLGLPSPLPFIWPLPESDATSPTSLSHHKESTVKQASLLRSTALAFVVSLALTGCGSSHKGASPASPSANNNQTSTSGQQAPATSAGSGGTPSKTNMFNKMEGDPHIIPVSSTLAPPIATSWYDMELIDLYMIHKIGLSNKISKAGITMFFEPQKYGVASQNVFDRKAIEQSAMTKEQAALQEVPVNQPFFLNTQFSFNTNYNFKGQYFPMHPFSKASQYSFSSAPGGKDSSIEGAMIVGQTTSIWPVNNINVEFTNPDCVKNLSMPESKAKLFLNGRTNSAGGINNVTFAKVSFLITGIAKPSVGLMGGQPSPQLDLNTATLYAKLLKVTVYNNNTDAIQGVTPLAVYNCK